MSRLLNDEFELGRRLGGGAEGEVYEAVSVKTKKKVAVKFMPRPRQAAELLERIRKLKGNFLNSCPAVLDVFEADGQIVTVLELVDGVPLRDFLASNDWSSSKRQALTRALIDSVEVLHGEGLAHGDLSPGNVFVSPDGKITLIDPRISTKQSQGAVFGTANYTAPEMLVFDSVPNPCGDVFSLCALSYEIFEGKDAFGCESPEEYVFKAGTKSLAVRPFERTPADFRSMITAGLKFDPRARPRKVEFLRDLLDAPGRRKWMAARIGGGILTAFLVCGGWYLRSKTAATIDSIAVLPFLNENHDPESEYLSEGLTESLINELTQLPEVRVSPRCKVVQFKGDKVDPFKAAQELGVRAVLTGRLLRRGDNLSVGVELLDTRDNKQVWGERYDRTLSAALEVQREISLKIFESLRAKMTGATQQRVAHRGTESPEAYQAYLKGRYFWNRRTAGNIGKALQLFQQAVDADPAYALAYIGLADCYEVLQQYAGVPTSDSLPKARAAAQRALEIDDSLAEAHASMGYINTMAWQFDAAQREFQRAIELDPNYPSAHLWYGTLLDVMGKRDKAVLETHRAQQLDPLSPITGTLTCNIDMLNGQTAVAVEECGKVLELDGRFPRAHDVLGIAYLKQGRAGEAMSEFHKAVEFSGRASQELSFLGYGYGMQHHRAEAMSVLRELQQRYDQRKSPGLFLAVVCAGLGDKDQAFAWLERDFQARSGVLIYVPHFPVFDNLRDDSRYGDLLRRIGLNGEYAAKNR